MEKDGIIEESKSLWLNPVVLTRKKSGKIRFCIDLRKVNDLIKLDEFEMPIINNVIRCLQNKKYFSIIDLKDGYFQVPILDDHKAKTAFLDGNGRLMQFTRMPQGYKNAPATFQRGMSIILKDLMYKKCLVYIDDILVFGETEKEHDENLEQIMNRLKKYKMNINQEKSKLKKKEVEFLGYLISENKIKPLFKRSEGILDFPLPRNTKQIRRFLGMINYDRMFIEKLSEKVKFLYNKITKTNTKVSWSDIERNKFEEIKKKWAENLELRMPNFDIKFELETDASDVGLGAVLRQNSVAIAYISRVLKGAELNYTIMEKEFLAAIWAMKKLEYYLVGREFDLITDHKALESIKSKAACGTSRIQRWLSELERFNFNVKYKKGVNMLESDILSRIEDDNNEEKILKIHEEMSHRKNIRNNLKNQGINMTETGLRNILENCEKCNVVDKVYLKSSKFVVTSFPGEIISTDLMDINKEYKVMIAIDYFTRKIWGKVISNKDPNKIKQLLEEIYKEVKFKTLKSDNGREFNNKIIMNFCKENNITRKLSVPYYHQSNGRVERVIRTIRTALKKESGTLKNKVAKVIINYNETYHRAIGMTPNEAWLTENRDTVIKNSNKYSQEFISKKLSKLKLGDKVWIRNDVRKNKMEDEWSDMSEVIKIHEHDTYTVKNEKDKTFKRHRSQLKISTGNVG